MGGFGALVLPLKHPDIFSVTVPLSISIRTDEQYKTEYAPEWDQQWGRLFGGVGKTGDERISGYYKENSPFHIIENEDLQKFKDLMVYIDNGDDENTLCRSNEELHILMRNVSFPHEFRVRNGGHEFAFWREALPQGLRFISDAFEGKDYRGDMPVANPPGKKFQGNIIENENYSLILPEGYAVSDRKYPVVYFMGEFNREEKDRVGGIVGGLMESGSLPPLIMIFLHENKDIQGILTETENSYRIRKGYRFRAIVGYGSEGKTALNLCLDSLQFTCCGLLDTNPDFKYAEQTLKKRDRKITSRTWYYIDSPDKGTYYTENGFLHILFRESDLYHEYRVREGQGGFGGFLVGLPEALIFIQGKIHK
jgi:enterochelin esterase-like enzyme